MKKAFSLVSITLLVLAFAGITSPVHAQKLVTMSPNTFNLPVTGGGKLMTTITAQGNLFNPVSPYGAQFIGLYGGHTINGAIQIAPSNMFYIDPNHIQVEWNVPSYKMYTKLDMARTYDLTLYQPSKGSMVLNDTFQIPYPVTGRVFADLNANGAYTPGEPYLANQTVCYGEGANRVYTQTDASGRYLFYHRINYNYDSLQVIPSFGYLTSYPLPGLFYRNTAPALMQIDRDFGLRILTPGVKVVNSINALPRCNTDSKYTLYTGNEGTSTIDSAIVVFIIPKNTTYVSADVTPVSINGDTIKWKLLNIASAISKWVNVTLHIPPSGTNMGPSTLKTTAYNIAGGLKDTAISVGTHSNRCSYDPNDKTPSSDKVRDLQSPLMYRIRFQNTGNDTALNIIVRDTLSNLLDWNTLKVIDASHKYSVERTGAAVAFNFIKIMLPDSIVNEPASHGYLVYQIMPKSSVPVGTIIHNTASIYFDLNKPVLTNDGTVKYCPISNGFQAVTVCSGDSIQVGTNWYKAAGTYTDVISGKLACDSVVTTVVTINNSVNATFTATANVLKATDSLAVGYQWYNCDNSQPIPGATSRTYTVTANGNYAVIVSNGNCSKMSPCQSIIGTGTRDKLHPGGITIIPNPATDKVKVSYSAIIDDEALIEIYDMMGRRVLGEPFINQQAEIDISNLPGGTYFVQLISNHIVFSMKKFAIVK